jgi:hypothetical protein
MSDCETEQETSSPQRIPVWCRRFSLSKGERFEYLDAVNFPNSHLKYKGGELQKRKDTGVHIIVVAEGAGEEVQSARASCRADVIPREAKPTASKTVVRGNATDGWWNKN